MSVRSIRLLHVEDDAIQRKLLQAHLAKLADFGFVVESAISENEAIAKLPSGFDLVLLDYHLAQGNGLACLKRIRSADGHIPIIAISGVATPEIAAELLEAGADDYFSKEPFDPEVFGRSVRSALARADAWKARTPEVDMAALGELAGVFHAACADYASFAGGSFVDRLDKIEKGARTANLTFAQMLRLFDSVCDRLAEGSDTAKYKRILRPIMLELVLRLYEETPTSGGLASV